MNDTTPLDDFERTIVRTLDAKANQIVADTGTFDPDEATPIPFLRRSTPEPDSVASRPWLRWRVLAAAAAVAVITGAAAVLGTPDPDGPEVTEMAAAEVVWSPAPGAGVVALLPAAPPEGWTFSGVAINTNVVVNQATWQLFAVDGPSPLQKAVLVGSELWDEKAFPGDPTVTVQGQPAYMAPWSDPNGPVGAPHLAWRNGDVYHDAVAVGFTEAELLAFVESLQPRAEAEAGFDASADTGLPELQTTTVGTERERLSSAFYRGPDGEEVSIGAETFSYFGGGLLERMIGEPHGDGYVRRRAEDDFHQVVATRADGWQVDAVAFDFVPEPGLLDGFLDSIQPFNYQQVVDQSVALPVTATAAVGDWSVEVHGAGNATQALCLTKDSGQAACGLALGGPPFTVGSVVLDGQWILVVVSDPEQSVAIETKSPGPETDVGFEPETLHGEHGESNGRAVEIVVMPDHVGAAAATGAVDGERRTSYVFEYRPTD